MLLHNKFKSICLLISITACSLTLNAQDIEVLITGIRSTQGQVLISVFKDQKSFDDEKPFTIKYFKKSNISKGEMTVNFAMEPGTYGFALVDDENYDSDMDYNFIGYPKEGFGFSNYYHSGLSNPSFDSFKFALKKTQKQKIIIKIRYM
jgi:uncharacterized protein (DUF2141 family)